MVEGPEVVCGCVQGSPTGHNAAPVSGSSRGSGVPGHVAEACWSNQYLLGQRRWNQGQNSSLTGPAAGNVAGTGPGSAGSSHCS